jgi:hypothetical protein
MPLHFLIVIKARLLLFLGWQDSAFFAEPQGIVPHGRSGPAGRTHPQNLDVLDKIGMSPHSVYKSSPENMIMITNRIIDLISTADSPRLKLAGSTNESIPKLTRLDSGPSCSPLTTLC